MSGGEQLRKVDDSLFKYFAEEKFASSLIERGEIFMQSLTAFQTFEDDDVRRDVNDGRLRHEPVDGLKLTMQNGEVREMPPGWKFVSSVQADQIHVYCMSTVRSEELASRFGSPYCVEITRPISMMGGIARHIRLRSQLHPKPFHGPIDYRMPEALPMADWALPERVAFIKPPEWSWQQEYRIVVGSKSAFAAENVKLTLEGGEPERQVEVGNPLTLRIGNLSKCTVLHRF